MVGIKLKSTLHLGFSMLRYHSPVMMRHVFRLRDHLCTASAWQRVILISILLDL